MPVIIAVTKTKTSVRPLASDTTAGPGQYPASPQPMPNITEPEIGGASIAFAVGRLKPEEALDDPGIGKARQAQPEADDEAGGQAYEDIAHLAASFRLRAA